LLARPVAILLLQWQLFKNLGVLRLHKLCGLLRPIVPATFLYSFASDFPLLVKSLHDLLLPLLVDHAHLLAASLRLRVLTLAVTLHLYMLLLPIELLSAYG